MDIARAQRAKARIRRLARSTFDANVLSRIGSFGGLFRLRGLRDPVLVSSIDGVGTKIQVAAAAGRHRGIGFDLVSHCVNDILVQGARPLFFLDYFAMARLDAGLVAQVVSGMARACRRTGCALIGGETAEMPGVYREGDYDVAGCIVGVVERDHILDGSGIRAGDRVYGLASTGLHTNGYSLARAVFFERLGLGPHVRVPQLGTTVAAALLRPHRCYLDDLHPLLQGGKLRGLAHITGGGLTENVPRILPANLSVRIDRGAWRPPALFRFLQEQGGVPQEELYRTLNMGVGMVAVVAPRHGAAVEALWRRRRTRFFRLGEVFRSRSTRVVYA